MEVKDLGIGEEGGGDSGEERARVGLPDAGKRSSWLEGGYETSPEANSRSKSGQAFPNVTRFSSFILSSYLLAHTNLGWKIAAAIFCF